MLGSKVFRTAPVGAPKAKTQEKCAILRAPETQKKEPTGAASSASLVDVANDLKREGYRRERSGRLKTRKARPRWLATVLKKTGRRAFAAGFERGWSKPGRPGRVRVEPRSRLPGAIGATSRLSDATGAKSGPRELGLNC